MALTSQPPETAAAVPLSHAEGELAGRWRRSLISWPDGSKDTATVVDWVQALTCYVDLRQPAGRPDFTMASCLRELSREHLGWLGRQEGFAGVTRPGSDAAGDYLEWHRTVDYTPADTPDAGRLEYAPGDPDTMVERGLAGQYVEHWHRDPAHRTPCEGMVLRDVGDASCAVLVRTGDLFGYARSRPCPLPPGVRLADVLSGGAPELPLSRAQDLADCEISLGRVTAGAWRITRSSLPFREGADLAVGRDQGLVRTAELSPDGVGRERLWAVDMHETLGRAEGRSA